MFSFKFQVSEDWERGLRIFNKEISIKVFYPRVLHIEFCRFSRFSKRDARFEVEPGTAYIEFGTQPALPKYFSVLCILTVRDC